MSLNDFYLGKYLGKGSFGSVQIVQRKSDNQYYAMKIEIFDNEIITTTDIENL